MDDLTMDHNGNYKMTDDLKGGTIYVHPVYVDGTVDITTPSQRFTISLATFIAIGKAMELDM